MSAIIPPVIVAGEIASQARKVAGGGKTAGDVAVEKATEPLGISLGSPSFWKRAGMIALGMLIIWWAILLLIASNDDVRGTVISAATKGVL